MDVVPTLVLPPQAGHDSCIVDYSPRAEPDAHDRRVRADGARTRSTGSPPRARPRDASIEDYLDVVDRAVEHCGGRVNLIGDCQGGWLATIYAALRPERVNTLTIAGAPIDFHAGEPVIHEVLRWLAPGRRSALLRGAGRAGGGVLKGRHMLSGFILIQPGAEISRQLELLCHLERPPARRALPRVRGLVQAHPGHPGRVLPVDRPAPVPRQRADRRRARGRGARRSSSTRLDMPLYLLAGATDHITPPGPGVRARRLCLDAAPSRWGARLSSGGHLGLFMGHEALAEHWPPLLAEVAGQSRVHRLPRRAGRRAVGSAAGSRTSDKPRPAKRWGRTPATTARGCGERRITDREVRDDRDVLRPPAEAGSLGAVPAAPGIRAEDAPPGMQRAYHARNIRDEDEIISFGLVRHDRGGLSPLARGGRRAGELSAWISCRRSSRTTMSRGSTR